MLADVEQDIAHATRKEYKFLGTCFVTLDHTMDSLAGVKKFNEYIGAIDPLQKAGYRVDDWFMEEAGRPSDMQWKSLCFDKHFRMSRKIVVAVFLIIFGFLLIFPFRYLVVFFTIYAKKEDLNGETHYVVYNEDYTVPQAAWPYFVFSLYVYGVNFLFLPYLIFRLNFYESLHKYSLREFVLMNKMFIYMVFNTVFLPGFNLTIVLRFVQLLAFPKLAQPAPDFLEQFTAACDSFINFTVFYTMDFFFFLMIFVVFMTIVFQVLFVFPHMLDRHNPDRINIDIKKRTLGYSGRIPFKEWFFSYDYQVPCVTAIFTIMLTYSSTEPLIIVPTFIFFILKYYFDFNHRILLGRVYFSQDMRHSNNTVRSSIVKYMFCSVVLYMTCCSLIFNSSEDTKVLVWLYAGLTVVAFVACVFFWRKWKLVNKPQIGNIFNEEQISNNKERFNLKHLSEMYRHPIETLYPSPQPKRKPQKMESGNTLITQQDQ
mmetsp:Transcript_10403/g.10425  ORF Transcript_10403/g.10425 Transcript_10403/m.10425 type:complete len:484 (+) Transcript_10403:580-2031(+)